MSEYAKQDSLKHGQLFDVDGQKYKGRNPKFHSYKDELGQIQFTRISKGLPFVRVNEE